MWTAARAWAGEVNLIGRKNEPMLQFDLDLGMRVDVEKKVAAWPKDHRCQAWMAVSRWPFDDIYHDIFKMVVDLTKLGRPKNDETDYWPGIVQIVHFVPWPRVIVELARLARLARLAGWSEFRIFLLSGKTAFQQWYLGESFRNTKDNENQRPALLTRLEELPEDIAQEVGWYLQDARLNWVGSACESVSSPISDWLQTEWANWCSQTRKAWEAVSFGMALLDGRLMQILGPKHHLNSFDKSCALWALVPRN